MVTEAAGLGRAAARPAARVPRWIWVAAVLLLEYLGLSGAFDAGPLISKAGWVGSVAPLGMLVPLVLAVGTATWITARSKLRAEIEALPQGHVSAGQTLRLLSLHAALFAVFVGLTYRLSTWSAEELGRPGLYLLLWALVGTASNAVLVHVALPARLFVRLLRSVAMYVAIGAGVGVVAWLAGIGSEQLWEPLGGLTLLVTAGLLLMTTPELVFDRAESLVGTPEFTVAIWPQCSGYEGIGLILVVLPAYMWSMRKSLRFPQALALLPIGILAVWLANSVRIAALILVGSHLSGEIAFRAFHSKAGWVLFCAVALGLIGIAQRSSFFSVDGPTERASGEVNQVAVYVGPLLAMIAVAMFVGLFAADLNPFYGLTMGAALVLLWHYRSHYAELEFSWSWTAAALGVLTFVIWIALEPRLEVGQPPAFLRTWSSVSAGTWLFVRVVGSVLVVPLVEELAFRGYALRRLISADFTRVAFDRFTWLSFSVSTLLFGLLHQHWLAGAIAGALFAIAQYRRGKLSDAILAHAVANACIAVYVLGWDRWALWG